MLFLGRIVCPSASLGIGGSDSRWLGVGVGVCTGILGNVLTDRSVLAAFKKGGTTSSREGLRLVRS